MDEGVFEERTRECQRRLREGETGSATAADADAVVLFPGSNLYYLTGFHEAPAERHLLLFLTGEDLALLVPELYAEQVAAEAWVDEGDLRVWADDEDPAAAVERVVADLGLAAAERVLVDERMWALFTRDLRRAMPRADLDLAGDLLGELRLRKDDAEIERLREVARRTDEVATALREHDPVGGTETELAREIEGRLTAAGCSEPSFGIIAGSGPNGARPHHESGERTIEAGDPVVLDYGGVREHYPSDQTRTLVWGGDPPEGFAEVHDVVREAQEAGVRAVEPGVDARAVDRAAREVIETAGYGEQFVHRTGHGVGLDVHEPPYITSENERELAPGMVFSVEPGVYLEGAFGVRIEDLVVVTEDGCERLNDSPRTWRV